MPILDGMTDERANALAQQLRDNPVFIALLDKMLAESLAIIDNPTLTDALARDQHTHWRHALQAFRSRVDRTVSDTGIQNNG